MSTERDELVLDIMQHPWLVKGEFTGACPSCPGLTIEGGHNSPSHAGHIADAVLAAGYRRPRTITTTEELDALLFEAVILDSYGTAYVCLKHAPTENQWDCPALTNENMPSWAIVDHGPFTVLHEGNAA